MTVVDGPFVLAESSLSRLKREVGHADLVGLGDSTEVRERAALVRAQVYVWLAALLERFVRDTLQALVTELNSLSVPSKDLRLSLFSLVCDPSIESIKGRRRQTTWACRVALFEIPLSADRCSLHPEIVPLDGKTLRGEHFDNIWVVFGLPGQSLPTPQHRAALRELADGRNDVAHGNVHPLDFGRSKTTADLLSLAGRVEDVVYHVATTIQEYIDKRYYLR